MSNSKEGLRILAYTIIQRHEQETGKQVPNAAGLVNRIVEALDSKRTEKLAQLMKIYSELHTDDQEAVLEMADFLTKRRQRRINI